MASDPKNTQAAHDAETVRLVRELCDLRDHPEGRFRIIDCRELYDILNRKPVAKTGGGR